MKLFLSSLLVGLAAVHCQVAVAETPRILTVSGEAKVEVPPDFIELDVLISAEDQDVDDAKESVDARTRDVVDAIKAFKIENEDLVFSGLTVDQSYRYDRNDNAKLTGYEVARYISIRLRDFDTYEQFVHLLVEAGIDGLQDVRSDVDDKSALERAALEGAARKAKLKAEAMASGLNIRLGSPVEVGENRLTPIHALQQRFAEDSQIEEITVTANSRGIEDPLLFVPDNITVRGTVMVRFEILED